jgi:hypothetical protein
MNDTREALTRLISEAVAVAAETSPGINPECDGQIVIDWHHGLPDFVAALNALALVIPRSDIVGTEYGWRQERGWSVVVAHSLDAIRHWEETKGGEAVTRPDLPWAVIPLPEPVEYVGGCTCDSPGGEFGHRTGCGYEPAPLPENGEQR